MRGNFQLSVRDEADGKLDVAIKQDRYVYELRL